jgi:hypothetical protein
MPLSKNLISTGELNKKNLHINTEHNTLYSTHQQKRYVIEPAYKLLTLPCTINNAMVHININYASNKRKASDSALLSAQMLTRQNAFLQEPKNQEDIKLDTGRFKELNSKFVLSRLNHLRQRQVICCRRITQKKTIAIPQNGCA